MKTKILLFLLLIAGPSLKANDITLNGSGIICSNMDSPAIGGSYEAAKQYDYYYQYRYIDLSNRGITSWSIILSNFVDDGQLSAGAINLENRAANYKVEVRRHDGTSYSDAISFTVYCVDATPTSTITITESNICSTGATEEIIVEGSSVSTGFGSVNYSWTVDEITVPGNGQNLNISLAPGTYRITRSHSGECVSSGLSNEKVIVIYENFVAGKLRDIQHIIRGNPPAEIEIIDDTSGGEGNGVRNNYRYQWQEKRIMSNSWDNISGARNATYQVERYGSFRRKDTDNKCGSTYTNAISISVHSPLEAGSITSPESTICLNTQPDEIIASEATHGIPSYTYTWEMSSNGSNGWNDIPQTNSRDYQPPNLTATTYYRRKVTDDSGASLSTDSIKITVRPEFSPGEITENQTICKGSQPEMINQTEEASGGSESLYSFLWEYTTDQQIWRPIDEETERNFQPPSLVQTHYYRRTVTDDICGTEKINLSTVFVAEPLVDNGIQYDGEAEFCIGKSLEEIKGLEVSGDGGAYSYKWEKSDDEGKNWVDINNSNTADFVPESMEKTMLFRRTVSGLCESSTSDYVEIDVYEVPQPLTNEKDYYCKGDDANIEVENADNKYTYKWYDDEGVYIQQGESIDYTDLQESMDLFVEAVEITSGCGSSQTPVQINVENVIADFKANLEKVDLGYPVEFTNNSQDAESYEWDFYDGSDLIFEQNPWHYYNLGSLSESVFYSVKLTASSAHGCVDSKEVANMVEVLRFKESNGRVIEFVSGNNVKVASSDNHIWKETTHTDGEIFVTNPVEDVMVITSGENISKVLVYSMSGQLVKSSDKKIVNLSSLRTGIYLVVIETESKNYKQVKIQKL